MDQDLRERPYPSIMKALNMLPASRKCNIVEIGSMRNAFLHDIHSYNQPCCNDGHSSVIFAYSGNFFDTVDIDAGTYRNVTKYIGHLPGVHTWCLNGLTFLQSADCPQPIDLLYLDAWDANYVDSAENHLQAYRLALPKLAPSCMVLIDDTDVWLNRVTGELELCVDPLTPGGKGTLVVPAATADGFKMVFCGRQTLLQRTAA